MHKEKLEGFWEVFDHDVNFATEIVDIFCQSTPEVISDIEKAIQEQDQESATDLLHRLKGSIGYIGFKSESQYLAEVEDKTRKLGIAHLSAELSILKAKLNELMNLVSQAIKTKATA